MNLSQRTNKPAPSSASRIAESWSLANSTSTRKMATSPANIASETGVVRRVCAGMSSAPIASNNNPDPCSRLRWCCRTNEPPRPALAPSATNTSERPATKARAWTKVLLRGATRASPPSAEVPARWVM